MSTCPGRIAWDLHTGSADAPVVASGADVQAAWSLPAKAATTTHSPNTHHTEGNTHTGGTATHSPVEGVTRPGVPVTSASIYSTGPGTGTMQQHLPCLVLACH